MNWKLELKKLKLEYIKAKSPDFFEASGGYSMKVNPYSDRTTNFLTKAVMDWLKYNGHYANRINTQGQVRKERIELAFGNYRENLTYTPSTTNKGTADVDSIISSRGASGGTSGQSVKIEIKCKATGDRIRPNQLKEKARVEAAGGIYLIVTDMETFVEWYKSFVYGAD